MFLVRIMHLKSISNSSKIKNDNNVNISKTNPSDEKLNKNSSNYFNLNNKTIEQIKNIVQEKNIKQNIEIEDSKKEQFSIKSLDDKSFSLINLLVQLYFLLLLSLSDGYLPVIISILYIYLCDKSYIYYINF